MCVMWISEASTALLALLAFHQQGCHHENAPMAHSSIAINLTPLHAEHEHLDLQAVKDPQVQPSAEDAAKPENQEIHIESPLNQSHSIDNPSITERIGHTQLQHWQDSENNVKV